MGRNVILIDDKMSRYNNKPTGLLIPTDSEVDTLLRLGFDAMDHDSGGSYNVLAKWQKGAHVVIGKNKLKRSANTLSDEYPSICGVHAELDLFSNAKTLKGGTVYVAGARASGSYMSTTKPCIYCSAILKASKVRHVVYWQNDEPTKVSTNDIGGIYDNSDP